MRMITVKRPSHKSIKGALAGAYVLLFVAQVHAADRFWIADRAGNANGVFNTTTHWQNGLMPGSNDIAHFGVTSSNFGVFSYTVSFTADATNLGLVIEDDGVTFDLSGHLYSTGLVQGIDIATVGGRSGRLTVINGVMNPEFTSLVRVGAATNASGALVVGAGGQFFGSANILVGALGPGTLNVMAGGDLLANEMLIGQGAAGSVNIGTATVTGAGSALVTSDLKAGSTSDGTLNIQAGGQVESTNGSIGFNSGVTGMVNVDGTGGLSKWNDSGPLTVGESGSGNLSITAGGQMLSDSGLVGNLTGSTGTATVDGTDSRWTLSGGLTVGQDGSGTLNVTDGGAVVCDFSSIGTGKGGDGTGTVKVSGAGSQWINARDLEIGVLSRGALNISDGGLVQVNSGTLLVGLEGFTDQGQNIVNIMGGQLETVSANVGFFSEGAVTIAGTGAVWDNSGDLDIGHNSIGSLSISANAIVNSANGTIASGQASEGHVTLDGKDGICSWINSGDVNVGFLGNKATLDIKNGGQVQSVGGLVGGSFHVTEAVVTIDGKSTDGFSSQWIMSGDLTLGDIAELDISNGGRVENANGALGGVVSVIGSDSLWSNLGDLSGQGRLDIAEGGKVEDVNGSVIVTTVSGAGSQWIHSGQLEINPVFEEGSLTITGGGRVDDTVGIVGGTSASSPAANVIVDGANSIWFNLSLFIGQQGSAALIVTNGGNVQTNDGFIGGLVTVSGADALLLTNLLSIDGRVTIGQGGTVVANQNIQLQRDSGGSGELDLVGGTLDSAVVTVPSGATFNFLSGTLHVGTFNTFFNGTLVNKGGTLAPGHSPGKTTIKGDYVQQSLGTLQIELAGRTRGGNFDFVSVSGTAALGGQLQLLRLNEHEFLPNPGEAYGILEAGAISGAFSNAASGQRLATTNGLGSFIVSYGPGSTFPENLVVLSEFQCTTAPGDFDCDGDVDADDLEFFERCAAGPDVPHLAGCPVPDDGSGHRVADFDKDGDIDQKDFSVFVRCFSGPDVPANPACAQ
ncbi:MAG: hypothetical protein HY287_09460 [Planctomycetes bacterium]|nr:hypothetical protein [Planctomycetota bacterium]MBI3834539.1 hypothetical protein [Planctomycetota bacterium]